MVEVSTEQPTESTEEHAIAESPATPAVEEKIDLSKHFAELKRRDRELQAERQKMKAEMEAERRRWQDELKTGLKSDTLKKINELGLSADELTTGLLGIKKEAVSPEAQLKQELEELKAWKARQEADAQQAQNDKIVADYRNNIFSTIEKSGDKFELILNAPGGKDALWESVVQYCKTYGEAPSDVAELAVEVEKALFERHKSLLGLKKFGESAKPATKKETSTQSSDPSSKLASPGTPSKTISNKLTGPGFKVSAVDNSSKTMLKSSYLRAMEESKQRILAKLK